MTAVLPHRTRMLLLVGVVVALFASYAGWTGLSYVGKVGGGAHLTAYLPTSGDSLGPASYVKFHGLVVGRVVNVLGPADGGHGSRAQIVVKPEHADQIPANVTARVLPMTIFGTEYVDLVTPRHPSTSPITTVDVVRADRSAQTLRIMDAVAAGERILRAIDPSQVDSAVSNIAAMLEDNGANVGRFVHRASAYLGDLLAHSPAFYRDLRLLGNVLHAGAAAEPQLIAALRNAHGTLRLVVDQKHAIDRLIASSTGLSSETSSFLEQHGDDLVTTIWAGEPIVHIYHGRRDRLRDLLRAVPHVLSNGAHGVRDGKIKMEGLMEFPWDWGRPYHRNDCTRYLGGRAANCPGGGSYSSPWGGR